MKTIKELAPKPSDAITAMIDGLREQSQREDFVVDMHDFGTKRNSGMCCGCAATCAIQKLTGINFKGLYVTEMPSDFLARVKEFELGRESMGEFEDIINQFRLTNWVVLLRFYDIEPIYGAIPNKELRGLWNDNWKENLHLYEAYRDQLKAIGL